MTTPKNGIMSAGILVAALFVMSPLTLANDGGQDHKHPSMEQMCDNLHEGKGRFNMEDHRAKMDKRHADMAKRLKLNEEQHQIWNQMRDERRAEHKQRMDKWKEKMEKRCQKTPE